MQQPTMTLAEFERLCEEGPLGSVTPDMMSWASGRVMLLGSQYQERMKKHNDQWQMPKQQRGPGPKVRHAVQAAARVAGMDRSLPAADRE